MGCPVGIGPEIILQFFERQTEFGSYFPVVLGDLARLREVAAQLGFSRPLVSWVPGEPVSRDTIPVLNLSSLASDNQNSKNSEDRLDWGRPTVATGRAMGSYIEEAVKLIQQGTLQAMVTCPISKVALKMAGYGYPGHTEMLAQLTDTPHYGMMMAGSSLKVVLVTIHEALSKVPALLSQETITACLEMTVTSLEKDFGIRAPRVAVCGLNPHAGEEGMFGMEEIDIIGPAIGNYSSPALISGPYPPDTVFHRAVSGEFDAVVAMYHDQGLVPFKLLHFSDGVNVTLGLPIVRTSVDHGTAYDIAGKGKADTASLIAAWELAGLIVNNRKSIKK